MKTQLFSKLIHKEWTEQLRSGRLAILLVKPVSRTVFLLSKFTAQRLVLFISMLVGILAMVFYTKVFFGDFPIIPFVGSFLIILLCIGISLKKFRNCEN
jgi:ABC-type transport system involved in multi-copper enzyme maturation permease subunit